MPFLIFTETLPEKIGKNIITFKLYLNGKKKIGGTNEAEHFTKNANLIAETSSSNQSFATVNMVL